MQKCAAMALALTGVSEPLYAHGKESESLSLKKAGRLDQDLDLRRRPALLRQPHLQPVYLRLAAAEVPLNPAGSARVLGGEHPRSAMAGVFCYAPGSPGRPRPRRRT